jgi:hypothetical protein
MEVFAALKRSPLAASRLRDFGCWAVCLLKLAPRFWSVFGLCVKLKIERYVG